MAERIADNADHIVDEMKRKARRRLVGAVVLALGAAIVLPLLLEKEPRPLGDDVSVQIPPVDEGKFVNRLTGKAGDSKALPKAETKAITAPPKSDVKPNLAAESTPASPPPAPTASDPPAPKKAIIEAEPRPLSPAADSASKTEAKPPAAPEPKAEMPAAATTPAQTAAATTLASAATPAKTEGFVVQLAAFADDKGANALANKLKKSGYAAYVQPVETSRGTLWRVRVGGYASRPEADAARATLKGEGYSGIIAPAQ